MTVPSTFYNLTLNPHCWTLKVFFPPDIQGNGSYGKIKLCEALRLSPQLYRKKVHYSKLFKMVHTNVILWSKDGKSCLHIPDDPAISLTVSNNKSVLCYENMYKAKKLLSWNCASGLSYLNQNSKQSRGCVVAKRSFGHHRSCGFAKMNQAPSVTVERHITNGSSWNHL